MNGIARLAQVVEHHGREARVVGETISLFSRIGREGFSPGIREEIDQIERYQRLALDDEKRAPCQKISASHVDTPTRLSRDNLLYTGECILGILLTLEASVPSLGHYQRSNAAMGPTRVISWHAAAMRTISRAALCSRACTGGL